MPIKVLVLDASERASLAFIRSLGRRGFHITAADHVTFSLGHLSRYCKKRIIYPSPEKSCPLFVKAIKLLLKKENFDVVIPVSEFTVTILSYYKDELNDYALIAVPDYDQYVKTYDKANTVQHLHICRLPHPSTYMINDIGEIKEVAHVIKYPAVIKPRRKVYWLDGKAYVLKVTSEHYVGNPKELITKYQQIVQKGKLLKLGLLPIIQEYIPGETYGVEILSCRGEVKAIFMHKRLAEYPITGGASTFRESVYLKELVDIGQAVSYTFKWHGLAMIEVKIDKRDGTPKIIEINGRPWGSLPLAVNAGVDFPYLYLEMLLGNNLREHRSYYVGLKQAWLLPGHLLWLYASLTQAKDLKAIIKFIKSLAYQDDVLNLRDSGPTIGSLKVTFHYLIEVLKKQRKITGEIL